MNRGFSMQNSRTMMTMMTISSSNSVFREGTQLQLRTQPTRSPSHCSGFLPTLYVQLRPLLAECPSTKSGTPRLRVPQSAVVRTAGKDPPAERGSERSGYKFRTQVRRSWDTSKCHSRVPLCHGRQSSDTRPWQGIPFIGWKIFL